MVVDDLDVLGACGRPPKAHPELVVHADAVLTNPVTLKGLKLVAWRNTEIADPTRDFQLAQLAPGDVFNLLKLLDPSSGGQRLGVAVLERDDHSQILTPCVINVKRDGSIPSWPRGFQTSMARLFCDEPARLRSPGLAGMRDSDSRRGRGG